MIKGAREKRDAVAGVPGLRVHICSTALIRDWTGATPVRPHWRIYWNWTEGAVVSHGGRNYALTEKRVLLIPPRTAVTQRVDRPAWSLFIHASLGRPYDFLRGRLYEIPATGDLRHMLFDLRGLYDSARRNGAVGARRAALLASGIVLRVMCGIPEEDWPCGPDDGRIRDIVEWMESEPGRLASNTDLAKRAHMATNSFIRVFRQQVGLSPQAYLMRQRLDRACLLLHYGDQSIDEIAERCGFCDRYHFSRQFSQAYGMGPAGYRRAMLA